MYYDKDLATIKKINEKSVEYIIKKESKHGITKLSHVFSELPPGIVYKDETGMGATTLELETNRHSIIVEPIKVTAFSKTISHNSKIHNQNRTAIYIGSPINSGVKVSDKEIINFLKNTSVEYKKILVVADSLRRVIEALKKIGDSEFEKYFILIDEVDSFQIDSYYRDSMERCLEFYKEFPQGKRALLSATNIDFSDPDLANEFKTFIRYDEPSKRVMDLCLTEAVQATAADKIIEKLNAHPGEKIMVAYNSVKGCFNISEYLAKQKIIARADIKILCSLSNRDSRYLEPYFSELKDDKLPAQITFVTSAYFTGFDLHEQFHLISISASSNPIHSLSEKRLKQIAGRCRKGLQSETIIYDLTDAEKFNFKPTLASLLETARRELDALAGVKKLYFNDPLLKQNFERVRKFIVEKTEIRGYRLVTTDKNNNSVISYLNIDSYLEAKRVRNEVYSNRDKLPNLLLLEGHDITVEQATTTTEVEIVEVPKDDKREEVTCIIEKLRSLKDQRPKSLLNTVLTKRQETIVEEYEKLCDYVDREQLLDLIQKVASNRDLREFNNLISSAHFVCSSPNEAFKRTVSSHLKIEEVYTGLSLQNKWKLIADEEKLSRKILTETQAVRLTNLFYKCKKLKDKQTKKLNGQIQILHENPFKLNVVKLKELNSYKERSMLSYSNAFNERLMEQLKVIGVEPVEMDL